MTAERPPKAQSPVYFECTECVWVGTGDQLDDDSQDWEVCPACGANVIKIKRPEEPSP